jgi:hypothetical protein
MLGMMSWVVFSHSVCSTGCAARAILQTNAWGCALQAPKAHGMPQSETVLQIAVHRHVLRLTMMMYP